MNKEVIQFETPYYNSFRCNKIATTYDLEIGKSRTRTIKYDCPPKVDENWKIGVIVGPSGSGKTSVARRHYGDNLYTSASWTNTPVIENFNNNLSFDSITGMLTSVGFASIPSWMQPYETLSNGEKFRVDLARALIDTTDNLIVFDEYTSVVDRTVAKTASFALRKAFNRNEALMNKKFIAVTCHYDILEWLDPDWVLDMRTGLISRRRLRRPKLIVKVYQCDRTPWPIFSQYHYLTSELSHAARNYIAFINDVPCAFRSTIHSLGHKNCRRGHRTVVLPEFQGIGLGTRLASLIADYETNVLRCKTFSITTSNVYFAYALVRTKQWEIREINTSGETNNGVLKPSIEAGFSGFAKVGRARIALVYVGTKG